MDFPRLIGVIHLPPLAGAPRSHGQDPNESLQMAGYTAVKEAQQLVAAGFDGIILENFGDAPFFKDHVPAETIASMAIIAAATREAVKVPVGINVLRNDGISALAIAAVTGCDFIRVNVLSGVTATDQGLIEGNAALLVRERERFHAPVAIFADAHVKHGISLSSNDIGIEVEDLGLRGMADAVIISGATTGRIPSLEVFQAASQAARTHQIPLYLGSGATRDTLAQIKPYLDGIIVGSTLRKGGLAGAPLDAKRIRDFIQGFKKTKSVSSSKKAGKSKKGR